MTNLCNLEIKNSASLFEQYPCCLWKSMIFISNESIPVLDCLKVWDKLQCLLVVFCILWLHCLCTCPCTLRQACIWVYGIAMFAGGLGYLLILMCFCFVLLHVANLSCTYGMFWGFCRKCSYFYCTLHNFGTFFFACKCIFYSF